MTTYFCVLSCIRKIPYYILLFFYSLNTHQQHLAEKFSFFSKNRAARGSDDGNTISSFLGNNQPVSEILIPPKAFKQPKYFIQKEGMEEGKESLREISI